MSTLNHPRLNEGTAIVLPEFAAAGIAYLSIIPAVVFLLSEPYKRSRFVRFNAWQSILLFIAWLVVWTFASVAQSLFPNAMFLTLSLTQMAGLVAFFAWSTVVWNAFDGKRTKLPLLGKLAMMQTADPGAYRRLLLDYRRLFFLPSLLRPLKERAGAAVAFFFLAFGRFFSTWRPVSTNPSSTIEN